MEMPLDERRLPDEALLAAWGRGRESAFTELVARHGAPIKGFALRMLHSSTQAEEVYVETFLRVARSGGRWEERGTVRAWLYTIARRLCVDVLRRRAVERRAEETVLELERQRGTLPSPEAVAQFGEQAERLERAIGRLPEAHREVLLLRSIHGLSAQETAAALGRTTEQVDDQLAYARRRLRILLGETRSHRVAG